MKEVIYRYIIPVVAVIIALFIVTPSIYGVDDEAAKLFYSAVEDYNNSLYDDALKKFNTLAEQGVENGKLFYNLGNAYFKKGDVGHSVLWYERALKLTPDDPDLKFNYDYVRTFVKDTSEDKESQIAKILFFWKHMIGPKSVQLSAIVINGIFWLLMCIMLVKYKSILKMPAYITGALTVMLFMTVLFNSYDSFFSTTAVVVEPEISVRSGLSDQSTELFLLHSGTKVKIRDEKELHYKIYFSEGKIGWANKGAIEPVRMYR